jgi:hypothetical protein
VVDAYFAALPPEHAPRPRELVAGQWLPMSVGLAHYAAIERIGLSAQQARENGRRVARSVQNTYLATLIRTLSSGVTLWSVLPRLPSFLSRLVDGGACAVYKNGPKDARIEIHGVPVARFAYVRLGWAGMFESSLELVTRKVYALDADGCGARAGVGVDRRPVSRSGTARVPPSATSPGTAAARARGPVAADRSSTQSIRVSPREARPPRSAGPSSRRG